MLSGDGENDKKTVNSQPDGFEPDLRHVRAVGETTFLLIIKQASEEGCVDVSDTIIGMVSNCYEPVVDLQNLGCPVV